MSEEGRIDLAVQVIDEVMAYLRKRKEDLTSAKEDLTKTKKEDEEARLIERLESLEWREAASKKCDYVRNAPLELVDRVRGAKGGIKGESHHFTASTTEATLFRFKRKDARLSARDNFMSGRGAEDTVAAQRKL